VSRSPGKKTVAGISFKDYEHRISDGRIENLYLFTGGEDYHHSQALRLLRATLDESLRDLNYSVFEIETGDGPAAALDAANELPMMIARRIVVIRAFDKIKDEGLDSIADYLKNPSPTSTVVFQAPSLDQRRKISNLLKQSCTHVIFDLLSDEEAASWAREYARGLGCKIDNLAVKTLITRLGAGLMRLSSELEKLASSAESGAIGVEIVESLVPEVREHTNWELQDAIVSRDRKRALALTMRLLSDGVDAVLIIGMLGYLYRNLLIAKEMSARNAAPDAIGKATNKWKNRDTEFYSRVARSSREELVYGVRRIAQVDNAVKNSEATPQLQLEYLVAELASPKGRIGV